MNFKKIALSLLVGASSLLAIDAVTNLSVQAPHNSGTVTNDASVDFTWSPPSDVAKYYYKLDTNGTNYNLVAEGGYSVLNSTGSSMSVTASASGDYYLHLVAVDSSDGTSAPTLGQVTSSIDIDAGTVTVTPDGGSITTDTNSITLAGSETGTVYYTLDGTTPTTSSSVYSTALTVGVSATLKTLLKDTAGNTGSVVSKAFTITNNPTVLKSNDNVAVDGTTITTSTTTALKVGGTDLTRYKFKKSTDSSWTTVSNIATTIDISGLSSGTYSYYILGGDAYNFQADSAKTTVTFTVDNTAPTNLALAVNTVEANENNASTVTFADNFTFTLSSNETNSTIKYTTDGTTPSATVGSVYTGAVTTTKTVSSGSALTFSIKFVAYDTAGNLSNVKSVNVTIDKEQPTLAMPTTQEFSNPIDVTISSNDSDATIYYLVSSSSTTTIANLKANGTTGTTATIGKNPTNSVTDSSYKYLHVIAVDIVGNGDEDDTDIQTVAYTYSATAVTLNVSGVTDGSSFATKSDYGATATTTVTLSGDNFTYYKYNLNDSNLSGETSNTLLSNPTISLASLTDGNYTLFIGVDTNTSGDFNLTEQNLSFTVDNTPSSEVVLADVNYTTTSYTVVVDKPADATTLYYSVNGGTSYTSTVSSSTDITITQDVNATASVKVYTADNVGNESNVTTGTYKREAAKTRVLSSDSLTFSSQNNYVSNAQNITVSNTGNSDTTIYSSALTSDNFTIATDNCSGNIITSGGTCIIAVDFNATTSGTKTAMMVLQYNGTDTTDLNISISGTSVNNTPVITYTDDVNTSEDINVSGVLTATDVEGSTLNFYVDTNSTSGSIVLDTNGSFTYSPSANANGIDWFTYYVFDGESNSSDTNITLNIAAINDLPIVEINGSTDESITIETNSTFTITYDTNDTADSEDVNVTINSTNAQGTVDINTTAKTILYTKDANATRGTGKYFTVIFSDGSGTDVNRTVNISLDNNTPSITNNSTISVTEDINSTNTIILSDTDDDNITLSIFTQPTSGSVTLADTSITTGENNTTFTYTPVGDYVGSASFVIKLDDGFGGIKYETIEIEVSNTNDAPTWTTNVSSQTTAEDTDLNVTMEANDIDPNDVITYSAEGNASLVTFEINGSILTIKPVENQNGELNITITATDVSGADISQTFDLNITAVDDAPMITTISPQRVINGVNNILIDVNATDIDGDTITYDINSSDTSIVTAEINGTGHITLDPQDVNGSANITVIAITADANTTTTFAVTIKDTNVTFEMDASSSSYDSESNNTNTEFALSGATLGLNENDNGKISATLDSTSSNDVNLNINVVGADISVDVNGTLTTSLTDGNVSKEIKINSDGTISNKVSIGDKDTEVSVNVSVDVNTSVNADGSVQTTFIKGSKSVSLTVDNNGTVTPSITGAVLPSTPLPAGTTTTVSDTQIDFVFELPAKLEFN